MLHWMHWLQKAKQYTAKRRHDFHIDMIFHSFGSKPPKRLGESSSAVEIFAFEDLQSHNTESRCGVLNSSPPGEVTKVMLRSKKNMKVKKAKSRTSRAAQNEGYVNQTVEQFKSLRYPAFVDQKPWLDADGNMVWSQWRMKAGELVFSQSFETAMGLVILFNMGIIMYEADQDALCFPTYYKDLGECPFRSNSFLWLYILNILLNIVSIHLSVEYDFMSSAVPSFATSGILLTCWRSSQVGQLLWDKILRTSVSSQFSGCSDWFV